MFGGRGPRLIILLYNHVLQANSRNVTGRKNDRGHNHKDDVRITRAQDTERLVVEVGGRGGRGGGSGVGVEGGIRRTVNHAT